jgi:hypothetical protein
VIRNLLRIAILILFLLTAGFVYWRFFRHPGAKLPTAVLQCLQEPQEMTLYSLDPVDGWEFTSGGAERFHNFKVLGQIEVKSPDDRHLVARTIERATSNWNGVRYMCFNPRHGLRITNESGTYDLLICFECQGIEILSGTTQLGDTSLTGSQAPLDGLLRAAHIPLPAK